MKSPSFYLGVIKDFGIPRTLHLARTAYENVGKKDSSVFSIGFIELSAYCKQRCGGCYMESERGDTTVLDVHTANNFIKSLHGMGTRTFVFIGGEPMEDITKKNVFELIENNPKDVFYVCTNGYSIDEHVSKRLSNAKNVIFALSIDGSTEINDKRRGDGAFDTAVRASKLLRRYKNPLGSYTTINSINYLDVASSEFIDYLVSLGFKYVNFQRHFSDDTELPITDEQYIIALRRLHELAPRKPIMLTTAYFGDLSKPSLKNRHTPLTLGRDGSIRTMRNGPAYGNLKEQQLSDLVYDPKLREKIEMCHNFQDSRDGDMNVILREIMKPV